jgi:hypothetical protein
MGIKFLVFNGAKIVRSGSLLVHEEKMGEEAVFG